MATLFLQPLGRRLRAGLRHGLGVLSVLGQGADQRSRGGQAAGGQLGVDRTALPDGFASCPEPGVSHAICDRLGPGATSAFLEDWWARLPPLTPTDRAGGCRWECSMRQVAVSAHPPGR